MSAGRAAGRRLAPAERRDELLVAATTAFVGHRYDDVTIEEVAAAASASKALLFHYFGSKRGLYLAVIRALAEGLIEATRLDDVAPSALGLERSLRAFHGFLHDHGVLFRSLVRGGVGSDREVEAIVDGARARMASRLWPLLGAGEGGPAQPQRSRLHAWLGAVEAAAVDAVDYGDVDVDAFVGVALDAWAALGLAPVGGSAGAEGSAAAGSRRQTATPAP